MNQLDGFKDEDTEYQGDGYGVDLLRFLKEFIKIGPPAWIQTNTKAPGLPK
jgi:hypothetical protein